MDPREGDKAWHIRFIDIEQKANGSGGIPAADSEPKPKIAMKRDKALWILVSQDHGNRRPRRYAPFFGPAFCVSRYRLPAKT